ncbi:piggyBac transposable element-derived protein 4 isoform X6 [Penaeus vannamei]|uniref:piggyBac transposable element-derived protein 4 isoform X6 n=1 Tax=Penaeus vannamei TaxID=6689 RepID=UPI00387F86C9
MMGRKSKRRTLQEEQGAATRATKRTEVDDVSKSSAFVTGCHERGLEIEDPESDEDTDMPSNTIWVKEGLCSEDVSSKLCMEQPKLMQDFDVKAENDEEFEEIECKFEVKDEPIEYYDSEHSIGVKEESDGRDDASISCQTVVQDISSSEEDDISDDENLVDDHILSDGEDCREDEDDSQYEASEEPTACKLDFQPKWKKQIYDVNSAHFLGEQPGPSSYMTGLTEVTPSAVFDRLIGLEMLGYIVRQTNLYALQKGKPFKQTTVAELKIFLGINILMGIKKQPSYQDYWSTNPCFRDHYITNAMQRDRFIWFLANLHMSKMPFKSDPNYDRLCRIRPLIDHLNQQFQTCYNPSQIQAIGDCVIKFKARNTKQFMPLKPLKRGYKVWVRADSNGYICQAEIFCGKDGKQGEKVLHKLTDSLIDKGYQIYADHFFSSVSVAKELLEKGIGYCGTIHQNRRKIPVLLHDKQLTRGQADWAMDPSGVSCTKWMDDRAVLIVSNMHNPSLITQITHRNNNGSKVKVGVPVVVADYRRHKSYVGKANMLKSLYEIDHKSKKWWHRIFFHYIDVAVVNAFIIYKHLLPQENIDLKAFRGRLIAGLIGVHGMEEVKKEKRPVEKHRRHKEIIPKEIRLDQSKHMPEFGPNFRRCSHCSTKKKPHRTRWLCTTCKVPLCNNGARKCFSLYHV